MSCRICGAPYREGDGTTIDFSNKYDKYLNRTFTVCNKCAYALLEKMLELDPVNKRLNQPTTYDDVVKREG
jgi:hypothetical protein